MSSPTFVFALLFPNQKLKIYVEKFPYLTVYNEEERLGLPLKIVWIKEVETMRAGIALREQLVRMSMAKRMKMVLKSNPDLLDQVSQRPVFAAPASRMDFGNFGDDGASSGGGVPARVPFPPITPLVAADAKALPREESEFSTRCC